MHWDGGWYGAGWWWLVMLFMMFVFWGGIAWVVVTLTRHGGVVHRPTRMTQRSSAEEILQERLARGEIDVDEYTNRLAALRTPRPNG
jgi:putative membrane protein